MTGLEPAMFEGVSDSIADAIAEATAAQLAAPSPCVGWNARDVLNHMIGGADLFAACARGEHRPFPDWSDMPDWVGHDPAASYRRGAAGLLAAFSALRCIHDDIQGVAVQDIMIRIETDDFEAWKTQHYLHAQNRLSYGITDGPAYQDIDNPHAALFHIKTDDMDRAMEWFQSDTFKEATRLAKVTGRTFFLAQPQAR